METIITALGPDNVGLADPIVHFVTGQGANIEEIQMYNHDSAALFAMLLRIALPAGKYAEAAFTSLGIWDGLAPRAAQVARYDERYEHYRRLWPLLREYLADLAEARA